MSYSRQQSADNWAEIVAEFNATLPPVADFQRRPRTWIGIGPSAGPQFAALHPRIRHATA